MQFQGSIFIQNAHIYTLNPEYPIAHRVGIRAGRIISLDGEPSGWEKNQILDAKGAVITPGFIDTHVHFSAAGMAMLALNLEECRSLGDVFTKISAEASGKPADYLVFATQFAPELMAENRFPLAEELDRASEGRPVYIMERTGHWAGINQAGLNLLSISQDLPGRQLDRSGNFTGVITGQVNAVAGEVLWPAFIYRVSVEQAISRAAHDAISGGITTLHALEELPEVRAILNNLELAPLRIIPYSQTRDVQAVLSLGLRQIGGCGSMIVDGDFGPHTAALLEPYADQPDTKGVLYWKDEDLELFVMNAHRAGLQIALHCVGSAAIEQTLNAYEKALRAVPRYDHRHRIEHFELPAEGQAERALRLGVGLAMQPAFNHFWPHDGEEYPRVVGEERAQWVDPVSRIVHANLPISFGSDAPVTPLRPLLGIHSAVNHSNSQERISVETALRLTTQGGAWFSFEEHEKGSLEIGKLGDLVLLGGDPYKVSPERIKDIPVLKTVIGGEIVFEK
jgi:predicted amidohydrolase YtcJ